MLTGYDPKITGVFSNVQFKPIPRGLSIFERLHQAFGKSGITTIMLTGKDHNLGSQGPTLLGDGEPYFLVRAGITEWDGDQGRSTSAVGQKAVGYIDRYAGKGRFFLFIHFPDVDYSGHRYGENSAAYNQAIVECDRWLGRIMAELASKGIADSTRLYVTADHGFDVGTTHHSAAPHIFLATNDTHVLHGGEQRDITPTILSMMGVDLAKVEPALPGKPLTK
jgi:predicted AlkP superfamily pyrophosphatase or phosphodiesterase